MTRLISLNNINNDLLLIISSQLDVPSIARLLLTCRYLSALFASDQVYTLILSHKPYSRFRSQQTNKFKWPSNRKVFLDMHQRYIARSVDKLHELGFKQEMSQGEMINFSIDDVSGPRVDVEIENRVQARKDRRLKRLKDVGLIF